MALKAGTFLLVVLFGSAAWMGTNSIWMQLPLITAVLPEAWSLPSYLAAVVQIACIGPLLYGISYKCLCNLHTPKIIIGTLVLLLVCSFLLIPFWDVTATIGSSKYSVALYVLMFGIALVNSTSNLLFMPFMAQFHAAYLNAYFVGMGLSSLIPSLLSLAQGNSNYECVAHAPVYKAPRFGVQIFFGIIAFWALLASIAFVILYRTGAHKKYKKAPTPLPGEKTYPVDVPDEETPLQSRTVRNEERGQTDEDTADNQRQSLHEETKDQSIDGFSYWWILGLTAIVNAQMNGVIPSIHSYAALPYSQLIYGLGVTLSNIVSPLASFLPFFFQIRSIPVLTLITAASSLTTAVIVFLATQSPNYLFDNFTAGATIAVTSPILAAGLHSFLRTLFASLLREGSHGSEKRLFWCGVFIQIGSFIGSAVMFPLVNFAHLFQSAPACR